MIDRKIALIKLSMHHPAARGHGPRATGNSSLKRTPCALAIVMLACLCLVAPASHAAGKSKRSLEQMHTDASALFRDNMHKEALPILRDILALSPGDPTALRYMVIFNVEIKEPHCRAGAAAFFAGDYKGATAQWEKVLEADPGDTRVRGLINEALLLSNRGALTSLYASAHRLLEAGKYNEAAHELEKILQIEPSESKARRLLDTIRASIEDTRISSLYSTASNLRARGEFDLAVEALNQVLKLDPTQELASRLIGSTRRSKHEATYAKARQSTRQGMFIQAREHYEKLASELPGDSVIKMEYEKLSEVMGILMEATAQGAGQEALRLSLYNYIIAGGDPELAVVAAQHSLELSGTDKARAVNDLMNKKLGALKTGGKGPLGILETYLLSALDNIYEGKYGRAVQQCSIVLMLETDNTMALKRLGSAYYLMGNKKHAASAWQKAQEIAPDDSELKEFIEMVAGQRP